MSMKLMVRVQEEVEVTRAQHAVLLAMANHADDDGKHCFPSVDRIAWTAGYKPRAVISAMSELRAMGVLVEVAPAAGRRPVEYEIHLEKAPKKATFEEWKKANSRHARGAQDASVRTDQIDSRGASDAPVQTVQGCNLRRVGVHSTTQGVHSTTRRGAPDAPEPVNQSQEPVKGTVGSAKARATRIPEDFTVTDAMREKAIGYGVHPLQIDNQTEMFLNHHRAKGSTFVDWRAAWYTWMQRAPGYAPRRRGKDIGLEDDVLEAIARGIA